MVRGRALWALTFVSLVLLAGAPLYHDARPELITQPGFTVFAVDRAGVHAPLALFDGQGWRPACEGGEGADLRRKERQAPSAEVDIAGLSGSPGAPLLPVRELTGESVGWESTADAVETRALAEMPLAGPRTTTPRVYSADAPGTGVAYVEVMVREAEPAFRGLIASAWVVANDPLPAQIIGFHFSAFASYPDYLAIERQIPLGIVSGGHEHVWVMKRTSAQHEDVRLVGIGAGGVREYLRVERGGC